MAFVFDHLMDRFDDGTLWFLHDTLEEKDQKASLQIDSLWQKPRQLALHQHPCPSVNRSLSALPNSPQTKIYADNFAKGLAALRRVLDHQPGEVLYRIFAKAMAQYYRHAAPAADPKTRINNAAKRHALVMYIAGSSGFFQGWCFPMASSTEI